ncbi:CHAT domain-containing protein [Bacillus mojavensis]|uniref:CHAT domain-containing protein n=1 Tax=Bacillus mojavensis TaxID=72360 RepID=UPI000288C330|nr:CHAT domain-containing protein [Bacillus mojavensis]MDR4228349.1 CHAT domain-containing protein [Bacillus mojavensis]MEC3586953.1 CHAT domain-containing protein [Bacillus mojavensis]MEC5242143.1 CHAT domain-containing protein [Bacillus mojavensis]MED0748872.1 CHAT domain-containing protein [Bacillus mojavensis]
MDISRVNDLYFNYYVIFNAEKPIEDYIPITDQPFSTMYDGAIHGFDPELNNVLPAIRYCLHLPRNGLDTFDLQPKVLEKGYEVPHSIILIPSYSLSEIIESKVLVNYPPTLFISEDNFTETAEKITLECKAPLGHVKISDLSEEMLQNHWKAITQLMNTINSEDEFLITKPKLLSGEAISAIPLSFNANQLDWYEGILESLRNYDFINKAIYYFTIQLHSRIKVLVHLEDHNNYSPTEKELLEQDEIQRNLAQVPTVITLSGTANRHRPRNIEDNVLERNEKDVVDILGIHRAAARNGYWFDGGYLPKGIFIELNQLETHCKGRKISNKYVWSSMKRIGRILASHVGEEGLTIIDRASHITAFTDFPVGLAILPGYDDPLCCIKPISYRSLTPLTRALQMELPRVGELYIGKGFKVVIAECLLPEDGIRKASDSAWKMAVEMLNSNKNVNVSYSEIKDVEELKTFLGANTDADILVISAHGYYDDKKNVAGLWIGDDLWFAADDDEIIVPPIVILSACHVSPRGGGAVTVTDLLHRKGAKAILGTLIPVNVFSNAILTIRLFVYICEALSGRGKMRTLNDAWRMVVASNAVHEIISSSRNFKKWAQSKTYGGHSIIEEFGLVRSTGRLRYGFVYTDTISILEEMAKETGFQKEFKSSIASQGVFPESCFYVWSGTPENVILTEPILEEFQKRFDS